MKSEKRESLEGLADDSTRGSRTHETFNQIVSQMKDRIQIEYAKSKKADKNKLLTISPSNQKSRDKITFAKLTNSDLLYNNVFLHHLREDRHRN